jgi:hypothetical protein
MKLPKEDSNIIQVGTSRKINPKTGKSFLIKYSDVPKDKAQWVTDPLYLPITGDMMTLRIKDRIKELPGWWDGRKWQGLRIKSHYKITAWKRVIYYD